METPEAKPLPPALRRTRWIKGPFTYEDPNDKRVHATFTTNAGDTYKGTGEIRARHNRKDNLFAIDLAFTRMDSPYQITDIIFHLSSRQAACLKKAPDRAEYDYFYDGHLTPDDDPNA
jgi:hypothetical protein